MIVEDLYKADADADADADANADADCLVESSTSMLQEMMMRDDVHAIHGFLR